MVDRLIKRWNDIDKKIIKLMLKGFRFSFIIAIISTFILITYEICYITPDLYYIGLSLFKSSIFFIAIFIICGISFDKIKKELG